MNKDKFIGALYGVAVGDALGAPYEFRRVTPKLPYDGILVDEDVYAKFQYSTIHIKPHTVTDDTEMTLTLLSSILEKGKYDRDDVILRYLEWASASTFMGRNTRMLMKGVKTIKGFEARREKADMKNTQSNGSLMRALPLVLLGAKWKEGVVTDTSLTNENDVNIECSMIFVGILRYIIFDDELKITCEQIVVKDALRSALKKEILPGVMTKSKGWVVYALYVAVLTLLTVKSFEDGMDFIYRNFMGGDMDTIMSISGALLGALYGYDSMTKERKTKINIEKLSVGFELNDKYNLPKIVQKYF